MKLIPLTRGQFAKVDNSDFERFGRDKWSARFAGHTNSFYAIRTLRIPNRKRKTLMLHREILGLTNPLLKTDHKNHDTLDCRKGNLRSATSAENARNRRSKNINSTSGFRGVSLERPRNRWRAKITKDGKQIFLGYFKKPQLAASAYARANKNLFGRFGGGL